MTAFHAGMRSCCITQAYPCFPASVLMPAPKHKRIVPQRLCAKSFPKFSYTHPSPIHPHNKSSTTAGNANLRIGPLRPRQSFPMRSILRNKKIVSLPENQTFDSEGRNPEIQPPNTIRRTERAKFNPSTRPPQILICPKGTNPIAWGNALMLIHIFTCHHRNSARRICVSSFPSPGGTT